MESSTLTIVNAALVESWRWYDDAPVEAFQIKVSVVGLSVTPLAGEIRDGAKGTAGTVVKLRTVDQLLVPPEFFARTRQ